MASLFNDVNSSDDSDDADYNPEEAVCSSDEDPIPSCLQDEIETGKTRKRKLKATKEESPEKSDNSEVSSSVDAKKSADDLFRDFLADVEKETSSSLATDSCYESPSSSTSVESSTKSGFSSENLSDKDSSKLFDFAGETVSVPKEVLEASDVKPVLKKKGGLSSVLDSLQKKPKLTVLDKSILDWRTYKSEQGIEDDLKQYNRGRGGYMERKRFLEKCDQKSFEIERDMRLKKRKS